MAVSKDFRVKKGLVVGQDIDASSGDLSVVNVNASGSLSVDSFNPAKLTASTSVTTPSVSAGGINLTNDAGNVGLGTLDSVSATVGTSSTEAILVIPTSKYRSGKIVVQAVAVGIGTDPPATMETSEILYIQGNSEINLVEYATVGIGNTSIVTYTGVINGSNVEIRATNNHGVDLNILSTITQLYAIT